MEKILADTPIYKISYDTRHKEYSWHVGQRVSSGPSSPGSARNRIITRIVRNEASHMYYGSISYVIYAKPVEDKTDANEYVFRYIENKAVEVCGMDPNLEGK